MSYQLEKWIWTEADFEQMGWHDARIYAVQFGKSISFDLDYIFEWVRDGKDDFFSFIVAPVTLVFLEPTSILFNVNFRTSQELEIEDIHRRTVSAASTEWCIETHHGDIIITANTFHQIVKRPPTRQFGQQLLPEERGEPNFSVVPDYTFVQSDEINRIHADHFALRQKAAGVRQLRRQLTKLLEQRSAGVIEVKRYLLEKRELEKKLNQLYDELKNTKWQGDV
ncbi:hypothetical protein ACW9KT_02885 [Hymenobacter sp. HD11105]